MVGITCGRCTKVAQDVIKHDSVAAVRACYAAPTSFIEDEWHAQAEAEIAAEQAAERFWEEGTAAQQAQYAWEEEQEARALGLYG
jgi:hypothetical protein